MYGSRVDLTFDTDRKESETAETSAIMRHIESLRTGSMPSDQPAWLQMYVYRVCMYVCMQVFLDFCRAYVTQERVWRTPRWTIGGLASVLLRDARAELRLAHRPCRRKCCQVENQRWHCVCFFP